MLPVDREHVPPLNITLVDHRAFGRKPIIGMHQVNCLSKYYLCNQDKELPKPPKKHIEDIVQNNTVVLNLEESPKERKHEENDVDWWSKYYASIGEESKSHIYLERGYEKIKVI